MTTIDKIATEIFIMLLISIPLSAEDVPWDPLPQRERTKRESSLTSNKTSVISPGMWLIAFHQQILSECDGPRSHFYPTSSEYMKQAVQKYTYRGFFLGMDRLIRENSDPWVYRYVQRGSSIRKWDPIP